MSQLVELENTLIVNPDFKLNIITDDPDDNIILECATEAGAEVVIFGDDHLLSLSTYEGIPILTPVEYLQRFF